MIRVDRQKINKKMFGEIYDRGEHRAQWIYSRRHMRFSGADIPILYERRPHKEEEEFHPEYLYRIDGDGIHIALFYGGLPVAVQ
jgi:hypothetical protein